jgi:hypothetical protein
MKKELFACMASMWMAFYLMPDPHAHLEEITGFILDVDYTTAYKNNIFQFVMEL